MNTRTRPQAAKRRYSAEHLRWIQETRRSGATSRRALRKPRPTERRAALREQEA